MENKYIRCSSNSYGEEVLSCSVSRTMAQLATRGSLELSSPVEQQVPRPLQGGPQKNRSSIWPLIVSKVTCSELRWLPACQDSPGLSTIRPPPTTTETDADRQKGRLIHAQDVEPSGEHAQPAGNSQASTSPSAPPPESRSFHCGVCKSANNYNFGAHTLACTAAARATSVGCSSNG